MKRLTIFTLLLAVILCCHAEEKMDSMEYRSAGNADLEEMQDSSNVYPAENDTTTAVARKRQPFYKYIFDAADAVTNFFMGCDTNYVTPQLYEFTAQAELSYWHDYYRIDRKSVV